MWDGDVKVERNTLSIYIYSMGFYTGNIFLRVCNLKITLFYLETHTFTLIFFISVNSLFIRCHSTVERPFGTVTHLREPWRHVALDITIQSLRKCYRDRDTCGREHRVECTENHIYSCPVDAGRRLTASWESGSDVQRTKTFA